MKRTHTSTIIFPIFFLITSKLDLCDSSLPSYIKACALKTNFYECALKNGNEAIQTMIKGDREFNIPSFIPLKIPFLRIAVGSFNMNLTNSEFSGMQDLRMTRIDLNLENKYIEATVTCPLIRYDFEYSVTGAIASLPIDGEGHGRIDIVKPQLTYGFNYKKQQRNGKTYISLDKDVVKIEPEKMITDLQNLFGGNEQLGKALNDFLNENWQEVLREFGPAIKQVYGQVVRKIFENLFKEIPADELFSDWHEIEN